MPIAPADSSSTDGVGRSDSSTRLLIALGVLGAVSVMIAALVIFSNGASTGPAERPVAPVRTAGEALIVGRDDAPAKVVVYEDFASPRSREFEMASRDFLQIAAAHGQVQVEYHVVPLLGEGYSTDALSTWGGVVSEGTARQASALRDLIFDHQPAAGQPAPHDLIALARMAGVRDEAVLDTISAPYHAFLDSARQAARAAGVGVAATPVVFVDSAEPLSARNPTDLADQVQRLVLGEGAGS